ncbi:MAG: S-methyl-5'-thioadenosine phosphorylase [Candidatus Magasanikbacteria bacterium]|nr:S-methyl-5'-thioadenosine phosphorylase [Candidatus Magasanikbacteria bacterium]
MVKVGIIGGSGLEDPDLLKNIRILKIKTQYGKPSSSLKIGKINNVDVVMLSRHGSGHTITPSGVNYRANIYALKLLGCTHIISTTAVGSLRTKIQRGDIVILDQFIDLTRFRTITFFDRFKPHKAKHTPMSQPFSPSLRNFLIETTQELGIKFHDKGTVITIEGPRFSTKAESLMFRQWGADVINMSIAPEVILANEIGIPYASIAMSTDYDCWKEGEDPVSWEAIVDIFEKNVEKVKKILINTISKIN